MLVLGLDLTLPNEKMHKICYLTCSSENQDMLFRESDRVREHIIIFYHRMITAMTLLAHLTHFVIGICSDYDRLTYLCTY